MAYKTFAAIDVGSNDVSMKIFEVTARKGFRELDYVSNMIELGSGTYKNGRIENDILDELCEILLKFRKKMKEYNVVDYIAYATSAIREATNSQMILDRIKRKTEFTVTILGNAEHRFMMYKGLSAKYENLGEIVEKNTALVDIGAGSVQISIFDKEQLSITQNIPIGSVRVRDSLSTMEFKTTDYYKVIEEYINDEITTFRNIYLKDKQLKQVIAIGDEISSIIKTVPELNIKDYISLEQFTYIYKKIIHSNVQDISVEYGIPFEQATLIIPSAIVYLSFLKQSKADTIWIPNIVLCDGIVAHYMEKSKWLAADKSFDENIITSAHAIAKRYRCSKTHIENVSEIALKIFDSVKRVYGLGLSERMQLEVAAILQDSGKYINMNDSANNSYNIILSTEIIGLSMTEKSEIANVVKYLTMYLPSYEKVKSEFGDCNYVKVAKLVAILRIANVLARSNKQKIEKYTVSIREKNLIITADTLLDLTLEAEMFRGKADFFEQVYGVRPILRQRRSL